MNSRTICSLLVFGLFPSTAPARPVPLAVPGFGAAALVTPTALVEKGGAVPVVVGLHGNFDRPEWFCGALEEMLEGRAFLLCPRGIPRGDVSREWDRWTFPARQRVLREIEAARAALEARHPGRLRPGLALLAGFSLGAILGSRFAVEDPSRFPRLYLVEGGQDAFTAEGARRFASKGGRAVLFGCGRKGCGLRAEKLCARLLRPAGVECSSATVPSLGHSYTDPLTGLAAPALRAILEGAAR